jgi:hypothetical protein
LRQILGCPTIFPPWREALELWADGMRDDGMSIAGLEDFEALRGAPPWAERSGAAE